MTQYNIIVQNPDLLLIDGLRFFLLIDWTRFLHSDSSRFKAIPVRQCAPSRRSEERSASRRSEANQDFVL